MKNEWDTVLLLNICLLSAGVHCQGPTFAGFLFTTFQSGDNLTISAAAINPSGNTSLIDVVFPGVQLPSSCGNRNVQCDLTLSVRDGSTRVAATVAVGNGAVTALFDRGENDKLIFIEQYLFLLSDLTCSLTTFVQDQTFLYGLCYDHYVGFVFMDLYRVGLNFFQLNLSSISRFSSRTNQFYISPAFLSLCSGFERIYWLGNGFLYNLRVDVGHSTLEQVEDLAISVEDSAISQCFDNGTQQLVLFKEDFLLAYCNNSITVEVDACQRALPILTETRFYCSGRREVNITVQSNVIRMMEYSALFPLNLSLSYVGDCVEINEQIFFVGSSSDGNIALTDVISNRTNILTTSALVNHQVVDDRFVLYSDPTSSTILDLSCPEPFLPIYTGNISFDLSSFFANKNFDCSTIQPTTPPPTTSEVSTVSTAAEPPSNRTDFITTIGPDLSTSILPTTVLSSTVLPTTFLSTTILSTTALPTTVLSSTALPSTVPPTTSITNFNIAAVAVPVALVGIFIVVVVVIVFVALIFLCTKNKDIYRPAEVELRNLPRDSEKEKFDSIVQKSDQNTDVLRSPTPSNPQPPDAFTAFEDIPKLDTVTCDDLSPFNQDEEIVDAITDSGNGHKHSALLTSESTAAKTGYWDRMKRHTDNVTSEATESRSSTFDTHTIDSPTRTDSAQDRRVGLESRGSNNSESDYVTSTVVQDRTAPSILISNNQTFLNDFRQDPNVMPIQDNTTNSAQVIAPEEESQNRQSASCNEVEHGRRPLVAQVNRRQEQNDEPRQSSSSDIDNDTNNNDSPPPNNDRGRNRRL